jgi:hypothetical protein
LGQLAIREVEKFLLMTSYLFIPASSIDSNKDKLPYFPVLRDIIYPIVGTIIKGDIANAINL